MIDKLKDNVFLGTVDEFLEALENDKLFKEAFSSLPEGEMIQLVLPEDSKES